MITFRTVCCNGRLTEVEILISFQTVHRQCSSRPIEKSNTFLPRVDGQALVSNVRYLYNYENQASSQSELRTVAARPTHEHVEDSQKMDVNKLQPQPDLTETRVATWNSRNVILYIAKEQSQLAMIYG